MENVKSFFGLNRTPIQVKVKEIGPRPRRDPEREIGWIRQIAEVNPDWRDADFSKTMAVAEGPNAEGFSIELQAPEPEIPAVAEPTRNGWATLDRDGRQRRHNLQLSQFSGSLQEIYIICIDSRGRNRALPEKWNEVSREAVNGEKTGAMGLRRLSQQPETHRREAGSEQLASESVRP